MKPCTVSERELMYIVENIYFVGLWVLMDCAGGAHNPFQGLEHD